MSPLPQGVTDVIEGATGEAPTRSRPSSGGSINQAATVTLADGRVVFAKWHVHAPTGFFEAEADGLQRLAATQTLRVPTVLAVHDDPSAVSVLVLEHVPASSARRSVGMADLGRRLAAMHGLAGHPPGLERANFIGSLEQPNDSAPTWLTFFVERRLAPLSRCLDATLRLRLLGLDYERLLREPPAGCSLLHGDLWGGNALTTPEGHGIAIDPAVYAGHPEVDLAMTHLFGGFDESFYGAYQEVAGRFDSNLGDRLDLYNLYPLLVHVNLFGGGYVTQIARTLDRFSS